MDVQERRQQHAAMLAVAGESEQRALDYLRIYDKADDGLRLAMRDIETARMIGTHPSSFRTLPRLVNLSATSTGRTGLDVLKDNPEAVDMVGRLQLIDHDKQTSFTLSGETQNKQMETYLMKLGVVLDDGYTITKQDTPHDSWKITSGEQEYNIKCVRDATMVFNGPEVESNLIVELKTFKEGDMTRFCQDGDCASLLLEQLEHTDKKAYMAEHNLLESMGGWVGTKDQGLIPAVLKRMDRFQDDDRTVIETILAEGTESPTAKKELALFALDRMKAIHPFQRTSGLPIVNMNAVTRIQRKHFETFIDSMDQHVGQGDTGFESWYKTQPIDEEESPKDVVELMRMQSESMYQGVAVGRVLHRRGRMRLRRDVREFAGLIEPDALQEHGGRKRLSERARRFERELESSDYKLFVAYSTYSTLRYLGDAGLVDMQDQDIQDALGSTCRTIIYSTIDRELDRPDSQFYDNIQGYRQTLYDKMSGMSPEQLETTVLDFERNSRSGSLQPEYGSEKVIELCDATPVKPSMMIPFEGKGVKKAKTRSVANVLNGGAADDEVLRLVHEFHDKANSNNLAIPHTTTEQEALEAYRQDPKSLFYQVRSMDDFIDEASSLQKCLRTEDYTTMIRKLDEVGTQAHRQYRTEPHFMPQYEQMVGLATHELHEKTLEEGIDSELLSMGLRMWSITQDLQVSKMLVDNDARSYTNLFRQHVCPDAGIGTSGLHHVDAAMKALVGTETPSFRFSTKGAKPDFVEVIEGLELCGLDLDSNTIANADIYVEKDGCLYVRTGPRAVRMRYHDKHSAVEVVEGKFRASRDPNSDVEVFVETKSLKKLRAERSDDLVQVYRNPEDIIESNYMDLCTIPGVFIRNAVERLRRLQAIGAPDHHVTAALRDEIDKGHVSKAMDDLDTTRYPFYDTTFNLPPTVYTDSDIGIGLIAATEMLTPDELRIFLAVATMRDSEEYYHQLHGNLTEPTVDHEGLPDTPMTILRRFEIGRSLRIGISFIDNLSMHERSEMYGSVREMTTLEKARIASASRVLCAREKVPPEHAINIYADMVESERVEGHLGVNTYEFMKNYLDLSIEYEGLASRLQSLDSSKPGEFCLNARVIRDDALKFTRKTGLISRGKDFNKAREFIESHSLEDIGEPERMLLERLKGHVSNFDKMMQDTGIVLATPPGDQEFTKKYGESHLDTVITLGQIDEQGIGKRPSAACSHHRFNPQDSIIFNVNLAREVTSNPVGG